MLNGRRRKRSSCKARHCSCSVIFPSEYFQCHDKFCCLNHWTGWTLETHFFWFFPSHIWLHLHDSCWTRIILQFGGVSADCPKARAFALLYTIVTVVYTHTQLSVWIILSCLCLLCSCILIDHCKPPSHNPEVMKTCFMHLTLTFWKMTCMHVALQTPCAYKYLCHPDILGPQNKRRTDCHDDQDAQNSPIAQD